MDTYAFAKSRLTDCYSDVGHPEDPYSHYRIDGDGIVGTVRELLHRELEADEDREDEL